MDIHSMNYNAFMDTLFKIRTLLLLVLELKIIVKDVIEPVC